MEFKQALSVQLKFLHLHDKVLTAAFTHKKKETDRRLTPARTTLAVAASTIRRSENLYPCNATFSWKPQVLFADHAQAPPPPPPAGQHTWPHHKNCSGMCEEHDEDLKALNLPPNSPDPNLMEHVCRNEFDSWRPCRTLSRCPGATRRRTSQEVLCLCLDRLEPVWSHVVLPSCTAVISLNPTTLIATTFPTLPVSSAELPG